MVIGGEAGTRFKLNKPAASQDFVELVLDRFYERLTASCVQ